jgi:hypothetical protein
LFTPRQTLSLFLFNDGWSIGMGIGNTIYIPYGDTAFSSFKDIKIFHILSTSISSSFIRVLSKASTGGEFPIPGAHCYFLLLREMESFEWNKGLLFV